MLSSITGGEEQHGEYNEGRKLHLGRAQFVVGKEKMSFCASRNSIDTFWLLETMGAKYSSGSQPLLEPPLPFCPPRYARARNA
jgi:hypothetical protein